MKDFLSHPVTRPTLILAVFVVIYIAYWFHMAGRIEQEIKAWAEDQAMEGTEVAYESLKVTGFPFRLVATLKEPDIFVRDGDRSPRWHGTELKAITPSYSFDHVILDFVGTQIIEVEEEMSPVGRPLSRQAYTIDGTSMMMSLRLNRGKILSADTVLKEIEVSVEEIGDYRPSSFAGDMTQLRIAHAEIHSRVREPVDGEKGSIAHDLSFELLDIVSDRTPPDGFDETISRFVANYSRSGNKEIGFHNGSLRVNRDRSMEEEESLTIHELGIDWQPVTLSLTGELETAPTRDATGQLDLAVTGHKDLVRALHAQGEVSHLAALLAGALFGIVELVSETDESGVLHIPLKVKDGEVSFGFLPLFTLDELGLDVR